LRGIVPILGVPRGEQYIIVAMLLVLTILFDISYKWGRHSLAMLEDRSWIPGAHSNVLVTRSDWPTLVSSVCYASLVSASADRDLSWDLNVVAYNTARHNREITQQEHTFHSHDGGTYTIIYQ